MQTQTRFSLQEASSMLPLVQSIARELVERRAQRWELVRSRRLLEESPSPEGLVQALSDLDAQILAHTEAIDGAQAELEHLGLTILRLNPLTIHFPGQTKTGEVVFCWQEGEESVCFGHPVGHEEDPRRPLKLRTDP